MNDWELLQAYLQQDSESAFTTLVESYAPLVYSAAFRQTNNSALAEEITQATFIILARKARSLRRETVLAGWLFRTTRHVALTSIRSEQRRHRREQAASDMSSAPSEPEVWNEVAPMLDEALAELGEADRNAILVRFFQQKSFAEVGLAMGTTEDAAKKRVTRAVDKLRHFFVRRGIGVTGASLMKCLGSVSVVQSAPVGLARRILSLARARQGALPAASLLLVKEALRRSPLEKAKILAGLAGAVIVATFLGTVAWQKWRSTPNNTIARTGAAQIPTASTPPAQPLATRTKAVVLPATLPLRVAAAEDGRALARAAVRVDYFGAKSLTLDLVTDRRGSCQIPLAGRTFIELRASVTAGGYVPREVRWFCYEMASQTAIEEYTLRLERGRYLAGSVQDSNGQFVAGAQLEVSPASMDIAGREQVTFCSSQSDLQGQWTLDQLPAGVGEVPVTVQHPDFAFFRTNLVLNQAAQTSPAIQLSPGVSIGGLVTRATVNNWRIHA